MKLYSRVQLRTAVNQWKPTIQRNSFAAIQEVGVEDFLDFLDTYDFREGTMAVATRPTGTVKWYNSHKGYGFITPHDKAPDIFLHHSDLNGLIVKEGDEVEYDVVKGAKGLKAVDIVLL